MDSNQNEKMYKEWAEFGRSFFTGAYFPGGSPIGGNPLFESWTKDFLGLYDKVMTFPPFSVAGGTIGQDPKAFADSVDLAKAQAELYGNWTSIMVEFSKAWVEGTSSASAKLSSAKFETPEAYRKQAYNLFIKELESKFDSKLRDEKFASKLGKFLSSYLEVKQKSDKLIEKYQTLFNIPTRTEIDRIYREVHDLRRDIRRLSRKSGVATGDRPDE